MFIVREEITLRVVSNMKVRVLVLRVDGENSNIKKAEVNVVT